MTIDTGESSRLRAMILKLQSEVHEKEAHIRVLSDENQNLKQRKTKPSKSVQAKTLDLKPNCETLTLEQLEKTRSENLKKLQTAEANKTAVRNLSKQLNSCSNKGVFINTPRGQPLQFTHANCDFQRLIQAQGSNASNSQHSQMGTQHQTYPIPNEQHPIMQDYPQQLGANFFPPFANLSFPIQAHMQQIHQQNPPQLAKQASFQCQARTARNLDIIKQYALLTKTCSQTQLGIATSSSNQIPMRSVMFAPNSYPSNAPVAYNGISTAHTTTPSSQTITPTIMIPGQNFSTPAMYKQFSTWPKN